MIEGPQYRLDQRDGQIYTYDQWRDISYGFDKALVNVNDEWDKMAPIQIEDLDKLLELQEKMRHIYQKEPLSFVDVMKDIQHKYNMQMFWGTQDPEEIKKKAEEWEKWNKNIE